MLDPLPFFFRQAHAAGVFVNIAAPTRLIKRGFPSCLSRHGMIQASEVGATGATKFQWLRLRLRLRANYVAPSDSGSTPLLLNSHWVASFHSFYGKRTALAVDVTIT